MRGQDVYLLRSCAVARVCSTSWPVFASHQSCPVASRGMARRLRPPGIGTRKSGAQLGKTLQGRAMGASPASRLCM